MTLDVSPEITWLGQPIDFMEIMGNIIENACKYCLEFVEVSANSTENSLTIIVDDDGPGVAEDKRDLIFCEVNALIHYDLDKVWDSLLRLK